jgi:hypothetical protein
MLLSYRILNYQRSIVIKPEHHSCGHAVFLWEVGSPPYDTTVMQPLREKRCDADTLKDLIQVLQVA